MVVLRSNLYVDSCDFPVYDGEVWGLSILLLGGTSQFNPCEWYMAKVMVFNKKEREHVFIAGFVNCIITPSKINLHTKCPRLYLKIY